jgi:hypothetical protein
LNLQSKTDIKPENSDIGELKKTLELTSEKMLKVTMDKGIQ